MCALPSVSSTPYRIPLLPPSRSSYFSDFNHLNNSVAPSPCSRRIFTMQRKTPTELDKNIQKEHTQARINVSKVKFSLLLLAFMSASSILFAFLALQTLLSMQSKLISDSNVSIRNPSSTTFADLRPLIWEVASSISLIAITSSITTFFISTVQLFFALKILKSNPTSIKRILSFLSGGRFLRCVVYTIWFFSILFFIVGCVLHSMLAVPPIGSVSKGIGVAFGIASTMICAAGIIHCIYVWSFSPTDDEIEQTYIDGNLSTLV